jgi:hypothetical protein
MANGEWVTNRERKQLAVDAREQEREQLRLEKRYLRDLRWAVERSTIEESDWADLLTLHQQHGKEGPLQLWRELVPYWNTSQKLNGGAECPKSLIPERESGILDNYSQKIARTKPTSRKAPGQPRKKRTDAGQPRGTYKPRSNP